MSVLDGQAVSAAVTNPAFLKPDVNDYTVSQLGMQRNNVASGSYVLDIQKYINNVAGTLGLNVSTNFSGESDTTGTAYGSTSSIVAVSGDTHKVAIGKLANAFAATIGIGGHAHTGSGADGAQIPLASSVTGILPIGNGGTGQVSFAAGVLKSSGTVISSGLVSLTGDTAGILSLAKGGTSANLTAANGAIPYSTASAFELLAPGSSGQVLTSGGGAAPTWQTPAAGNVLAVVAKTANYTLTTSDNIVTGNSSGGTFTLTLPTAVSNSRLYTLIKTDSSFTKITIATTSAQTIGGASTKILATQNEQYTFYSDGSNWLVMSHSYPSTYSTVTMTSTFTTNTTVTALMKRVGDTAYFQFRAAFAGAPNNPSPAAAILPTGLTIDTAKLTTTTTAAKFDLPGANGTIRIEASASFTKATIEYLTNSSVQIRIQAIAGVTFVGDSGVTNTSPATIASGDNIAINFSVPIVDWLE